MALWATLDQVLVHLGMPTDTTDHRVENALDVANAWTQGKRPDLDPASEIPSLPNVQHGVVIMAGLIFRERSTPQGVAGYEDTGGGYTDQTAYYRCLDLIGYRRPMVG